jgi:HEAT repeat protein
LYAASTFVFARDPRIVGPLTQFLKDSDARVRSNAVWALCNMRDPRTTELLIPLLKDVDHSVRCRTAAFLAKSPDAKAKAALAVYEKLNAAEYEKFKAAPDDKALLPQFDSTPKAPAPPSGDF